MALPEHVQGLIDNTTEIRTLTNLHVAISGTGPGRRHNVEILNKSALVLLVACWEAYIEDLATLAYDFMLNNAEEPNVFPDKVLTLASKPLKNHEDNKKVWALAGEGWKNVLKSHRDKVLSSYVGKLNTPKPDQVNSLFKELIGLNNVSQYWKWRGLSNSKAKQQLTQLVELRGEVAHRVKSGRYVRKDYVTGTAVFIQRLAAITSNRVTAHVGSCTGKEPWLYVSYKGLS